MSDQRDLLRHLVYRGSMIILRRFKAAVSEAEINKVDFQQLALLVGPDLKPVLRPALERQADVLGLPIQGLGSSFLGGRNGQIKGRRSRTVSGEIFTDGQSLFVFELLTSGSRALSETLDLSWRRDIYESLDFLSEAPESNLTKYTLRFYYIGSKTEPNVAQAIASAADELFATSLQPEPYESDRFKELLSEGRRTSDASIDAELQGARALEDRQLRALAIAIKASGGLLVKDLAKQMPAEARERIPEIVEQLSLTRLVDAEIVVVCRKSQSQVARVPSKDALKAVSDLAFKCACGRPIADESVEEALTVTELGRRLLDGSRWLTLLLLVELQRVGVPLDQILIEQQVGGDEVDCLAVVSGELVFFELKDKDFNLGNAYSFGAKVGLMRPDHAVICTTQKVGGDAREHFERSRLARGGRAYGVSLGSHEGPKMRYMEGLDELRSDVEKLASEIYLADANNVLQDVLSLAAIKPLPLLEMMRQRDNEQMRQGRISGLDD